MPTLDLNEQQFQAVRSALRRVAERHDLPQGERLLAKEVLALVAGSALAAIPVASRTVHVMLRNIVPLDQLSKSDRAKIGVYTVSIKGTLGADHHGAAALDALYNGLQIDRIESFECYPFNTITFEALPVDADAEGGLKGQGKLTGEFTPTPMQAYTVSGYGTGQGGESTDLGTVTVVAENKTLAQAYGRDLLLDVDVHDADAQPRFNVAALNRHWDLD